MILATSAVHLQCRGASRRIFIFVEHIPVATSKSYTSQTKNNNITIWIEWL